MDFSNEHWRTRNRKRLSEKRPKAAGQALLLLVCYEFLGIFRALGFDADALQELEHGFDLFLRQVAAVVEDENR